MVKVLIVLALLGCAVAEPPVNRGYLPPQARSHAPSQQYGAPARSSAPSQQYGAPAPAPARFSAPSSEYGAPARVSAPAQQYGAPAPAPARSSAPAQQYGAPGPAPARFSAPSQQYGAPAPAPARVSAPSQQYGAPARSSAARVSSPAQQYGAPAAAPARASSRLAAPAAQYGAPARVYGAPAGYDDARARLAEDDLAEPANYEFTYAVEDYESGANFGHREDRQDESAKGEYRVLLPDGRTQIVEYEADQEGFRPQIRYEEPEGPYAASQRSQGGPY